MPAPPIGPGDPGPNPPPVQCAELPLPATLESAIAEIVRLRKLQAEADDLIANYRQKVALLEAKG